MAYRTYVRERIKSGEGSGGGRGTEGVGEEVGGIIGLTVELLGVVVADSQVVEDAVERRREAAAVDPVGEEVDELQLRGHEAEAAREPVPRQGPVCYRRRLLRARSSRRGEPSRRRGKLREAPLDRS